MEIDQLESFMAADPVYFGHPHDAGPDDEVIQFRLPDGWSRLERGAWTEFHPPGKVLDRFQGWKIHVATQAKYLHEVSTIVAQICFADGIPFKVLANTTIALAMNAKYAPRASSGKSVTIYPKSDDAATGLADRLHDALERFREAPRILTDSLYRSGPVHVRYGAFRPRLCIDAEGRERSAIEGPDGALIPDERALLRPAPDWVTTPHSFRENPPIISAHSPLNAYSDIRALHYSNGGGVYRARHIATGSDVILKEGRPFCGHDGTADAVERIQQEATALRVLTGAPGVPRFLDEFEVDGHHFCVREFVPGTGLTLWSSSRHPRITGDDSASKRGQFLEQVSEVMQRVRAVVQGLHDRGIVYRDLHPHNVIVGDNGDVSLIDFELAVDDPAAQAAPIGHAPFVAPVGTKGFDLDWFSADALHTWLLVPYVGADRWGTRAADHIRDAAHSWYTLGEEDGSAIDRWHAQVRLRPVLPGLVPDCTAPLLVTSKNPAEETIQTVARHLTMAEDKAASPSGTRRLLASHPSESGIPSLSIASGAAGVLFARISADRPFSPGWVDWLEQAALQQCPSPAGLWNGLDGVALVLARAGRLESACDLLQRTADLRPHHRSLDYANGLAGISLILREVGTLASNDSLVTEGRRLAEIVALRGLENITVAAPGLLHGFTGMALMANEWSTAGDDEFSNAARNLLMRDVDKCVDLGTRGLYPRVGRIFYPYLGNGSAGLAAVAHQMKPAVSGNAIPSAVTDGLDRALSPAMVLEPGLTRGRAGLLAVSHGLGLSESVATHLRELPVHLVDLDSGFGVPSVGGLRLAHDLATGSSGVSLALSCVTDGAGEILPFLHLPTYDASAK